METNLKLVNSFEAFEITPNSVFKNKRSEYNPNEWKKIVNRYLGYTGTRFFLAKGKIHNEDIWVVYEVNGIRMLKEVSYLSCLSSAGFKCGFIEENRLYIYVPEDGFSISNVKENLERMKKQTKEIPNIFFTNEM